MGVFDKIKQSLTRTTQQFLQRFDEVVSRADDPDGRSRPVDVETIEALEEALISADVGVAATERIVEAVRARKREGGIAPRSGQERDPLASFAEPTLRLPTVTARTSC